MSLADEHLRSNVDYIFAQLIKRVLPIFVKLTKGYLTSARPNGKELEAAFRSELKSEYHRILNELKLDKGEGIVNVVDKLPHHPRKHYARRQESDIKYIVIHHSGTKEGSPLSFARYHVEHRGWAGIGYHYVITKDGTIYKTNNITTVCYHARGGNRRGIGVCLVGIEEFSEEQLISLDLLIEELLHALPGRKVIGHREVEGSRTSCPGDFLMQHISKWRPTPN